jgi:hypothetical protein
VRGLVEQRDVLRVNVLDDAERGEAGAAADVDDLEVATVEVGGLERVVAHILGPVARVDDVVVDDGEEAVEPEGLRLVLDEPRRRGWPHGGRCRRAPEPRRGGGGGCGGEGGALGEGEGERATEAGLGGAEAEEADPGRGPARCEGLEAAWRVGGGHRHCRCHRAEDEGNSSSERVEVMWRRGSHGTHGWMDALRPASLSAARWRVLMYGTVESIVIVFDFLNYI